jgi:hypothetical protein
VRRVCWAHPVPAKWRLRLVLPVCSTPLPLPRLWCAGSASLFHTRHVTLSQPSPYPPPASECRCSSTLIRSACYFFSPVPSAPFSHRRPFPHPLPPPSLPPSPAPSVLRCLPHLTAAGAGIATADCNEQEWLLPCALLLISRCSFRTSVVTPPVPFLSSLHGHQLHSRSLLRPLLRLLRLFFLPHLTITRRQQPAPFASLHSHPPSSPRAKLPATSLISSRYSTSMTRDSPGTRQPRDQFPPTTPAPITPSPHDVIHAAAAQPSAGCGARVRIPRLGIWSRPTPTTRC